MIMQVQCWVTGCEISKNLVSADVSPSRPDELRSIELLSGLRKGALNLGKSADDGEPLVSNERWEDGLKLSMTTVDGKSEMTRFYSMADLNELILGTRTPSRSLTKEEALQFGRALMARKTPMTVAMFDAGVDIDKIKVAPGKPEGTLDGHEPSIGFVKEG